MKTPSAAEIFRQLIQFPGFDPRFNLFFHPLQDFRHDAVGHLHLGDLLQGFQQYHKRLCVLAPWRETIHESLRLCVRLFTRLCAFAPLRETIYAPLR